MDYRIFAPTTRNCVICNYNIGEVLFSCGHYNTCINCAYDLKYCVTCGEFLTTKKFMCITEEGEYEVDLQA